jgi:hypothetical protein
VRSTRGATRTPEPSHRGISWAISAQWQLETDLEKTSEVEVRFLAEGTERTRVKLEHRNLERNGEGWEGMRDTVGSPGGWLTGRPARVRRSGREQHLLPRVGSAGAPTWAPRSSAMKRIAGVALAV